MVFLYIKNFNYFKHFFCFVDKDWLIMFHFLFFCSHFQISSWYQNLPFHSVFTPLLLKHYTPLNLSCFNAFLNGVLHPKLPNKPFPDCTTHSHYVSNHFNFCSNISILPYFFCFFSFMIYLILFSPVGLSGLSLMLLGSCTSPCCQGLGC